MAPREDSPGAGLGLGLIGTLATRVSIRPVAPRGTELVMRFDVGEHGASGS
jgi:anti-sigma regulatory factor (Ser/Thr protein kinase)